jgi:hypothetical protein
MRFRDVRRGVLRQRRLFHELKGSRSSRASEGLTAVGGLCRRNSACGELRLLTRGFVPEEVARGGELRRLARAVLCRTNSAYLRARFCSRAGELFFNHLKSMTYAAFVGYCQTGFGKLAREYARTRPAQEEAKRWTKDA